MVSKPRKRASSARALDWFQSPRGGEFRGTLADEIGLDKTVQTLAAGIFEADGDAAPALGAGDLERLFAPARLGSGVAAEREIRPHIELGDNS